MYLHFLCLICSVWHMIMYRRKMPLVQNLTNLSTLNRASLVVAQSTNEPLLIVQLFLWYHHRLLYIFIPLARIEKWKIFTHAKKFVSWCVMRITALLCIPMSLFSKSILHKQQKQFTVNYKPWKCKTCSKYEHNKDLKEIKKHEFTYRNCLIFIIKNK